MASADTKTCTKCGETKPLTEYYKHAGCRDGWHSQCKACLRLAMKARRDANLEAARQKDRDRYWDNPTRRAAQIAGVKARYAENRQAISVQRKADYEADREAICASRRAEHASDPEKSRKAQRQYIEANRDKINKRRADYRERNRDAINARMKQQYYLYAATFKKSASRRRARLLAAFVADVDFNDILIRDLGICGICHAPITTEAIDLDHILPLAAGGTHEPDNVQLAHTACNRKKGAKANFTLAATAR